MPGVPIPGPPVPSPAGSVWDWLPGYSELQTVKVFIGEVSDWHMWASLGWIALGVVLLLAGLALWARLPQRAAAAAPALAAAA